MPLRLVITLNAAPGKGAEFAAAFEGRCREVMTEPGCLQFEVFRSVLDPDKLTLLELWEDEAALAAHAEVNRTRAPLPADLRGPPGSREDYTYSKITR
jgi:quinol monooxygenase YgiN